MDFKNNIEKKEKIEDFFCWLLDKDVVLEKEIDFSLCKEYQDPNIYFPAEIKAIFESAAMKRLKRVSQLALSIKRNPNLYHQRYEHSLGVYNHKLELIMKEWENLEWRNQVEQNNEKIYLLGELIKSATHDIGHMPLSHVMEIKITKRRDFHEEIGKRIVLEDKELQNIFQQISPNLISILNEIHQEDYDKFGFKQHDESNYDIDRLDYLKRDSLYRGYPITLSYENYSRIIVETNENGSIKERDDNNSVVIANNYSEFSKEIHVYEPESLLKIEKLLETRLIQYENGYFSDNTQILDTCIGIFAEELINNSKDEASNLRNFVKEIKYKTIEDINIDNYLKWDDIRFWNEVISVAENTNNSKLKKLAELILPNLKELMNLTFEALDCKNGKSSNYKNYSQQDVYFIKKIHKLIEGNSTLSNILKQDGYLWDNVLILSQENAERDFNILGNDLISSKAIIYAYKTKDPIYIKDKEGNIYELSKHPNITKDWANSVKEIKVSFCCLPTLTEEKKKQIQKLYPIVREKKSKDLPKINMSQIQVHQRMEDYFEIVD